MLEVHGVGYEVQAPMTTFYQLPEVGNEVYLFTHLLVREDAHTLFGFSTEQEKHLFRTLIKVNGVGPKLALAILSGISAQGFTQCVLDQDVATLTRVPGIGKKTAQRLIIEMRDKLTNLDTSELMVCNDALGMPAAGRPSNPADEAVHALIALGYKSSEASRMVSGIDGQGLRTEDIIRSALQAAVK